MLYSESPYNAFASTAIDKNDNLVILESSNDLSNDLAIQQTPKVINNDLLDHIDLNFISSDSEYRSPESVFSDDLEPFVIDSAVLESVFNDTANSSLSPSDSLIDDEINEILNQAIEVQDVFSSINVEERSKSNPVIFSDFDNDLLNSKRSFSTADLSDESSFSPESSTSKSKRSKIDELGCTPYNRKQRSAPLPPVVAKSGDVVSLKRARNTEAARRSRARKMERMSQLEGKCEDLIEENNSLKNQVEELKRQLLLAQTKL